MLGLAHRHPSHHRRSDHRHSESSGSVGPHGELHALEQVVVKLVKRALEVRHPHGSHWHAVCLRTAQYDDMSSLGPFYMAQVLTRL